MPINLKIFKNFWVAVRHTNKKNIVCVLLFVIWLEKVSAFITKLIDDLYHAIDPTNANFFNVSFPHKLRSVITYLLTEVKSKK